VTALSVHFSTSYSCKLSVIIVTFPLQETMFKLLCLLAAVSAANGELRGTRRLQNEAAQPNVVEPAGWSPAQQQQQGAGGGMPSGGAPVAGEADNWPGWADLRVLSEMTGGAAAPGAAGE
jgi:hypothetical protein